ncbi:branched-chain amino acid transport system II carrier protein [Streptococcus marimammalium]|uniref:branched-chain amino acid transport system II carrier protein n=1 Tax=Streptococcus marimammalium TaxID=269666 RepID=UPI0003643426|nr:branched-chain amino acid transport system II carrier protein [Streptococcus marimammalium]
MNHTTQKNKFLIIGFMLFALFFGAGNLIFPAFLGIYSGGNIWPAVLGFLLTAVTLPLLGVIAISYTGATNPEELARPIAKPYAIFFSVALYLSIGPFFAIPRTGATSYSVGIAPIFGDSLLTKALYALVFFGISYWLAIKPNKIAERIGKYLTPALLVVIAILIIFSFIKPAGSLGTPTDIGGDVQNAFSSLPFVAGIIQGYGTMDALASLAFSILVINAAKSFGDQSNKELAKTTMSSGVIATILLALIYIFITRIGATSQSLFTFLDGQFMMDNSAIDGGHILSQSANFYLGQIGQIILSIIIFLACLTTSTGLITACAEYFNELVPKISYFVWVTLFTIIATTFYFGGLAEIINWSVPVLFLLYPLTITLIFLSLTKGWFKGDRLVYQITTGFTLIPALFDAIHTLSKMTGFFTLPKSIIHYFTKVVFLGQYSMGWISFAFLGFVISFIISFVKRKAQSL